MKTKDNKINVVVFGASGHAKVIIDILELEGKYNIVGLIDSYKAKNQNIFDYQILGNEEDIPELSKKYHFNHGIIAIGDNWTRKVMYEKITRANPDFEFVTTIHPSVVIGKNVSIGKGTVIMPGAIINADSKIGDFCIINTKTSVGHDSILENYSSLSSGVTLGGNVYIKEFSAISIGATIIQDIIIGKYAVIGAGSVVTKNIDHQVVAYGVPAKFVRKRAVDDKYLYQVEETVKDTGIVASDKLDVITGKHEWSKVLNEIGQYDFYHTYDYHLTARLQNETPFLLKYTTGTVTIALPLLLRQIDETMYSDASSVYGYPGPICNGIDETFNNEEFTEALQEFFIKNNIVSVFSRLNPFMPCQEIVLKNYGETVQHGKVVNIDITLDADEQRRNYQSRLKTHVNKSKKHCVVKEAATEQDITDFVEIYHENMGRVNAKKYYYFGEEYFKKIINSSDFKTLVLIAKEKETGKTIAGSMFIVTNNIVQYHLSGSKNEYLHLMPTKLLIDEMRLRATKKGYEFFNLGGGLGGRDDDSLFNFKSSFSKDFKPFKLWKLIVNPKIYSKLAEKNKPVNKSSDFFPEYRANNN